VKTRLETWAGNEREGEEEVGGRDRVRTCDPLLAKQVLSQLSYTPTAATSLNFKAFCRLAETAKGAAGEDYTWGSRQASNRKPREVSEPPTGSNSRSLGGALFGSGLAASVRLLL
jgi:hypothetical protein